MKTPKLPEQVALEMVQWFQEQGTAHFTYPDMRAESLSARTDAQRIWDHAILTAAEFVRRLHGPDDIDCTSLFVLFSNRLPKDAHGDGGPTP